MLKVLCVIEECIKGLQGLLVVEYESGCTIKYGEYSLFVDQVDVVDANAVQRTNKVNSCGIVTNGNSWILYEKAGDRFFISQEFTYQRIDELLNALKEFVWKILIVPNE